MAQGNNAKILFYATNWCPDCLRAKRIMEREEVDFQEINVDIDKEAEAKVKQLNNGNRSVPTIIFPDGTQLTEPSGSELREKLRSLT
ncbi:MAG: thioredoxin family protein [Anaerolineales bacterium]|nr:thioredoxin family protein [Anaerolineales bacterium]